MKVAAVLFCFLFSYAVAVTFEAHGTVRAGPGEPFFDAEIRATTSGDRLQIIYEVIDVVEDENYADQERRQICPTSCENYFMDYPPIEWDCSNFVGTSGGDYVYECYTDGYVSRIFKDDQTDDIVRVEQSGTNVDREFVFQNFFVQGVSFEDVPACGSLTCTGQIDFMVVMDVSGSINGAELADEKEYVQTLSESFTVSPNGINMGLITFATFAQVETELTGDESALQAAIDGVQLAAGDGQTDISAAINAAVTEIVAHDRDVPPVILLITDGVANVPLDNPVVAAINAAEIAKNDHGITIYAVAVGNDAAVGSSLESIASLDDNGDPLVVSVTDFDALSSTIENIIQTVCTGFSTTSCVVDCNDDQYCSCGTCLCTLDNEDCNGGEITSLCTCVNCPANREGDFCTCIDNCGANSVSIDQSDCSCICEDLYVEENGSCTGCAYEASDCPSNSNYEIEEGETCGRCVCEDNYGGSDCSTCTFNCNGNGDVVDCSSCSCYDGFSGDNCEICDFPCSDFEGSDGGQCNECNCINFVEDNGVAIDQQCSKCVDEFAGICSNGGAYVSDFPDCYCVCPDYWTTDSDRDCTICSGNCLENGSKQEVDGNCDCVCKNSWTGANCDSCPIDCGANGSVYGSCEGCVCTVPYEGGDCTECTSGEIHSFCNSHGILEDDCQTCTCTDPWRGTNCEICGLLEDRENGDTSICNGQDIDEEDCDCNCPSTHQGDECEECSDDSPHSFCSNYGTINRESFPECSECICDVDHSGDNCEECLVFLECNFGNQDIDNCGACICEENYSPDDNCLDCLLDCQNGSVQIDDESGACLSCECPDNTGWEGVNCEVCNPELITCENGGTLNTNTCVCDCIESWTGNTCDVCDLSECISPNEAIEGVINGIDRCFCNCAQFYGPEYDCSVCLLSDEAGDIQEFCEDNISYSVPDGFEIPPGYEITPDLDECNCKCPDYFAPTESCTICTLVEEDCEYRNPIFNLNIRFEDFDDPDRYLFPYCDCGVCLDDWTGRLCDTCPFVDEDGKRAPADWCEYGYGFNYDTCKCEYVCGDGYVTPEEECDEPDSEYPDCCVECKFVAAPCTIDNCFENANCRMKPGTTVTECFGTPIVCDGVSEDECSTGYEQCVSHTDGYTCEPQNENKEDGTPCNLTDSNVCKDYECQSGLCVLIFEEDCVAEQAALLDCEEVTCDEFLGCVVSEITCSELVHDPCERVWCEDNTCHSEDLTCDDSNPCTTDYCTPFAGCVNKEIDCAFEAEDENNLCKHYFCDSQVAAGEDPCIFVEVDCEDNNPCTENICDPTFGCKYPPIICEDDGDLCTTVACVNGVCEVSDIDCDDGLICTEDSCVAGVCFNEPIVCQEADGCDFYQCFEPTESDAGGCKPVTGGLDCQTNNHCIEYECQVGRSPSSAACVEISREDCSSFASDNLCENYICNTESGECELFETGCPPRDNGCTLGECDPATGACVYSALECETDNACEVSYCVDGACVDPEPVVCTESDNLCFTYECNPFTEQCEFVPLVDCGVGGLGSCSLGQCNPTTGECIYDRNLCNDDNPCTLDICYLDTEGDSGLLGSCQYITIECVPNDAENLCLSAECRPGDDGEGYCALFETTCIDSDEDDDCEVVCNPDTGLCEEEGEACGFVVTTSGTVGGTTGTTVVEVTSTATSSTSTGSSSASSSASASTSTGGSGASPVDNTAEIVIAGSTPASYAVAGIGAGTVALFAIFGAVFGFNTTKEDPSVPLEALLSEEELNMAAQDNPTFVAVVDAHNNAVAGAP